MVSAGALAVATPAALASEPASASGLHWPAVPTSAGLVARWSGLPQGLVAQGPGFGAADSASTTPVWPRLQARLFAVPFAALPQTVRLGADPGFGLGASPTVVGDLYFSSSLLGPRVAGGFRASSGWLLGSGLVAPDTGAEGWHDSGLARAPAPAGAAPALGLPYLGIGYTGVSVRGGWGVSADLGLVATNPGALRAGRSWQSTQAVDELMRELRLTPLVRLGVSYAF
jgi:hypothetical protein